MLAKITYCKTTSSKGLSADLFKKFSFANTYNRKRIPGTVNIMKGEDKIILNCNAQICPGKPTKTETKEMRLKWFQQCLDEIILNDIKGPIAIPYKIGCGLAGGDWSEYSKLLEEFDKKIEVVIYKL